MLDFANRSPNERMEVFQETAALNGFHPAIAEKDFWVCLILQMLFRHEELGKHLVFKGGTSLSKVHRLIDRFSEDIDLVLDWRLLGYGEGNEDPWRKHPSNTQRNRFNEQVNQAAANYISDTLCPLLQELLSNQITATCSTDPTDPHTVRVSYPATLSLAALRPEIRLEIGPLASWVPSNPAVCTSYAAESFPQLFTDAQCQVQAITAERTFWEKTTILHRCAHSPEGRSMQQAYSRHYYDVYMMNERGVTDRAIDQLSLLGDVVSFKKQFYPCNWANYDQAKPGSFRLIPPGQIDRQLQQDYRAMQEMIYGERPDWQEIIVSLQALERKINSLECTD